jgi:pimeloyl-ACP methyl ester carboxylesterase
MMLSIVSVTVCTIDRMHTFKLKRARSIQPRQLARLIGQLLDVAYVGVVALSLAACTGTPVEVARVGAQDVQRQITRNVVSTGDLSPDSRIVLQQRNISELWNNDPSAALVALHRIAVATPGNEDDLFALAEMSFQQAGATGEQTYYLAAVVYAYAFLFPSNATQSPNIFDPRVRTASDIYNRSLTSAFTTDDRSRVVLRSGAFALPFGTIEISYDPASARWHELQLSNFTPADELRVSGLHNVYRQRGLGSSLAADASAQSQETGFQVSADLKVPVSAVLRIDGIDQGLASGRLRGHLEVYPAYEPAPVKVEGRSVPLEADPTAAFAYGLSDPSVWQSEFGGFLQGDFFDRSRSQLVGLQPYEPGEIPVVFVHGTASSAGRWADLLNDLQSDPTLRERFQFWSFSYSTGNPIWYSALQLRTALDAALRKLDPRGLDPALHHIVLIGHSQGGLLVKYLVIDSGTRLWDAFSTKGLDQLRVSDQTRALLRQGLFVKPTPEVTRVIFIATPQHGSFVAGSWIGQLAARLVTLPIGLTRALGEIVQGNIDALRVSRGVGGFDSVWSMTPGNPLLQALADIPIASGVTAHSIIAVQGNGPVENGTDGVVSYKSAHLVGVASELVIRAGHSVQSDPRAVAEVRRILLLHLAETCIATGSSPISLPKVCG